MSIPAVDQILTYKDQLQISFTSAFEYVNNSDGSGIEDVSWWRPQPSAGFYPLGDLTHAGFGDANGVGVVATVKGLQAGVLQSPTGFTKVGTFQCDRINHLWFWRPTPPPGYVSLGLVVGAPGDTPPSPDVVMCIREDLVVPSAIGDMVWGGHGDESLARLWGTKPQSSPPGEAYFDPGTFVGVNDESLNAPKSDPSAYALQIDVTETPPSKPLPRPMLQSFDAPQPDASDTVEYIVEVPWFTVVDPQLTTLQQLLTSPRYRLARADRYHLLYYIYNQAHAICRSPGHTPGGRTQRLHMNSRKRPVSASRSDTAEAFLTLAQFFVHTYAKFHGYRYKHSRLATAADVSIRSDNLSREYGDCHLYHRQHVHPDERIRRSYRRSRALYGRW